MLNVRIARFKGNKEWSFLILSRKVRKRIQKGNAAEDEFISHTDKLYSFYQDFVNCPIDKYYHDNMHLNESGQRRTKLDAQLSAEWF